MHCDFQKLECGVYGAIASFYCGKKATEGSVVHLKLHLDVYTKMVCGKVRKGKLLSLYKF